MKKRVFLIFLCLVLAALLGSCRRADGLLDLSAFDDSFRAANPSLFYRENCDHDLRYRNMPDPLAEDDVSVYHQVSCYYGNCDFETHLEPHAIAYARIKVQGGNPMAKENGCFYHRLVLQCELCRIYPYFYVYVLCPNQDENCRGEDGCLDGADWREILCDTPYVILQD